ncbi:hypothetical protein OG203_19950 [Nocardia sp. NBC_01499]
MIDRAAHQVWWSLLPVGKALMAGGDDALDEVESSVFDVGQGGDEQGWHSGLDRGPVVGGSITDHQGVFGQGCESIQGQAKYGGVGFLYPVFVGQDKGVDQIEQTCLSEGRSNVEVNVAENAYLATDFSHCPQCLGGIAGEWVVGWIGLDSVESVGDFGVEARVCEHGVVGVFVQCGAGVDVRPAEPVRPTSRHFDRLP